jgi:hypothetical protein
MCNGDKNCKGCTPHCKNKTMQDYSVPCAVGAGGIAYGLGVKPMWSLGIGVVGGYALPKVSMSASTYDAVVGAGVIGIVARMAAVSQNMKYIGMGAGAVGGYMYGDKAGIYNTTKHDPNKHGIFIR